MLDWKERVTYVVFVDDVVAVELRWVRNGLLWPRRVDNCETYHVQTIPRRIASDDIDFLLFNHTTSLRAT